VITISRLGEDRWQDYRDLRLEALKKEPQAFSSSWEEEQLLPEAVWRQRIKNALFAMEDNKPVGTVAIFCNNRPKTKHVCEIFGVYLRKEYRGRGISKLMLNAALVEIKTFKGITKIKIGVIPTQKAAKHLYLKYGFKPIGHLKKEVCVDGKFYDELLMEQHL
jgi:RimJ/RimL family protein N-acetyltransferase